MILGCNICPVSTCLQYRLVVAPVTIFKLVGISPGSQTHQLVSKAYTEYGNIFLQ